jgi:hypothetical protein
MGSNPIFVKFFYFAKILNLDDRYENTPIVVFGDLNYTRNEVEDSFRSVTDRKFKMVAKRDQAIYTREQATFLGVQRSYLDYFIVKNLSNYTLDIL